MYTIVGGDITYPFVFLYFTTITVKVASLLIFSKLPNVLRGKLNKKVFALYSLVVSDICLLTTLIFIATTNLQETLLIPTVAMVIVNLIVLAKTKRP